MHKEYGFTLIEAVIVMTIAAITLSLGIPAMQALIEKTRLSGEHDRFMSAMAYARSLAVNTASRVVMCPSEDQGSCLKKPEWHRGWIIFVDDNQNRERDEDETIYLVGGNATDGYSITSSRNRRRIGFLPTGLAFGSNVTLRLCPADPKVQARAIILSSTGRARSANLPRQSCPSHPVT